MLEGSIGPLAKRISIRSNVRVEKYCRVERELKGATVGGGCGVKLMTDWGRLGAIFTGLVNGVFSKESELRC